MVIDWLDVSEIPWWKNIDEHSYQSIDGGQVFCLHQTAGKYERMRVFVVMKILMVRQDFLFSR